MLKFILSDFPSDRKNEHTNYKVWRIVLVSTHPPKTVAEFIFDIDEYGFDKEISQALAADYVEFLNSKYLDKEINAEWGKIDINSRIIYHLQEIERHKKQLELLKSRKPLSWNDHGNEVE